MRWLIDEMLPPETARQLCELGHDAVSVHEVGLDDTADEIIFDLAVNEERVVVTENFSDFSKLLESRLSRQEPSVPVVFVRKRDFQRGGGLAHHLAVHLDRWAAKNPEPYVGPHWP